MRLERQEVGYKSVREFDETEVIYRMTESLGRLRILSLTANTTSN